MMQAFASGREKPEQRLPNNTEMRNASVVVTVTAIALVLVEGDRDGFPHILRNIALFPAKAEEFVQMLHECWFPSLQSLWWDAISPRGFPVCQSLVEFFYCLKHVKLLHDRHVGDRVKCSP